ncbi:ABC-type transporter, integral membrane subunit [Gemmatirosa kalamazoonensis]|uniref:ABC-type transporter, integral membrane subunit n=1 Tax=Gemmatirosa kalamazoonensis TaxID=861299 RepID=W0RLC6_9BACT|nr:ABC transporter permease [Gemmatirosa kalamazoonensis]AHG90218.1 ABC-type transporter, integral membrane subunit [Gemmatirosa kalamazoonensis]
MRATRATRLAAAFQRLRRDPAAIAALGLLATFALLALFAPLVAPYNPSAQPDPVALQNRPPSLAHPLGTDPFSRDVLSRVLYGARVSLGVGVLAALLSTTVGAAYGAIAAWLGGLADAAMMRLVDAFLGIPRVLLLLAVVALWGHVSTVALVLLIAGTGWFGTSRLARAEVRSLREREFVHAARALGAGESRLLARHVVPHLGPLLLVAATLAVGNVIALEAGLSYLGLGVQPPQASWGSIMQDGADYVTTAWWTTAAPGILIVVTVLAVNVLGDGLRDALDPRE